MRTAVRAVVFSGVTVGIGLGVLLLVRVPFVQSFGLAGILIPIVTIAAALTLLPALMAMLGHRINRLRVVPERVLERARVAAVAAGRRADHARAAAVPARSAAPSSLLAAAPVRHLALGSTPLAVYPDTGPGSEGVKLLAAEFGSGGVAPVRILVDRPAADVRARRCPRSGPRPACARRPVVPGPDAHAGERLQRRRDRLVGRRTSSSGTCATRVLPRGSCPPASFVVGGGPAVFYDFQQALYGDFLWIALIVIAATVIVLFRAFRSVLLPVKAVLMNALSVAGAYGLMVAVFQHGVGAGLVGFHQTPSRSPSGSRCSCSRSCSACRWTTRCSCSRGCGRSTTSCPTTAAPSPPGLAKTGKLITSAALIMVIAFCGLAASRFIEMQQFGFGLAAAILLDATLIRALIVPSLMKLMGRWNWWLPAAAAAARGPRPGAALTATWSAAASVPPGVVRRCRCRPAGGPSAWPSSLGFGGPTLMITSSGV